MSELKKHSITNWVDELKSDELLCSMIGISKDQAHGVGSYYDLIDRVWLADPDIEYEMDHSLHSFNRKPKKKLGKNKKQPPRHPGIIKKFVDLALEGRTFESRPEILMQQIFSKIGVEPSAEEGLYGDTKNISLSGDGTCVDSGGSSLGNKACKCVENSIYNCTCSRKFSDPSARWGWDSYHERWFYGYTEYILSVYNKELKCDLPIYFRMVQAQRHDGVSAAVALSEAKKLYPDFTFNSFTGDSAHDNYATYELLHALKMKAFIALNETNKGTFKYPPHIKVDENGIPYCIGGHPMTNWGYNRKSCRIKYRCPYKSGKVDSCDCVEKCSSSEYGRCIYIKPAWDLRLFTVVPRGSDEWKTQMKTRTTSERVNKRLLNDYGLELSHTRGKKRICWWSVCHSLNVLLDARLKLSGFSFVSMLEESIQEAA